MNRDRFLATVVVTLSAAVHAAQPTWDYAEGEYARLDADFVPDPFHGFAVAATVQVADHLHLRWDASTVRFVDDDVAVGAALKGESTGIALGLHVPVSANAVAYGRLGVDYTRASASVSVLDSTSSVSEDGTGYDAELGIRANLADRLEVQIGALYDDVSGDTVAGVAAAVRLADPVALTLGLRGNGDLCAAGVGMRVYW